MTYNVAPKDRPLAEQVRKELAAGKQPAQIMATLSGTAPTETLRDLIAHSVDLEARGIQEFDKEQVHPAWTLVIPTVAALLFLFGFAAVAWSDALVPWTGTLLLAWRLTAVAVMVAGAMLLGVSTAKRRTRA